MFYLFNFSYFIKNKYLLDGKIVFFISQNCQIFTFNLLGSISAHSFLHTGMF